MSDVEPGGQAGLASYNGTLIRATCPLGFPEHWSMALGGWVDGDQPVIASASSSPAPGWAWVSSWEENVLEPV